MPTFIGQLPCTAWINSSTNIIAPNLPNDLWGRYNEDIPFLPRIFLSDDAKESQIGSPKAAGWDASLNKGSKGLLGKLTRSEKAGWILSNLLITNPSPVLQISIPQAQWVSLWIGAGSTEPLHICLLGCLPSITAHTMLQHTRAECNWLDHCLGQLLQLIMVWLLSLFPVTDWIRAFFAHLMVPDI